MSPEVKFIVFAIFGAASLAAGWWLRKAKLLKADASRPIHLWTLIVLWAPVTLWAFWRIEFDATLGVIMAIQPLAMIGGILAAVAVARLLKLDGRTAGVFVVAAAISNQGFTLGGYLCYAILTPAEQAISYAVVYVTAMMVCMVIMLYPVAAHFGEEDTGTVKRLMLKSFITIRALPLYTAGVGALLSARGVPVPEFIADYDLPNVFFFLGALGSYLGIGLRLRLGDSLAHARLHGGLAVVKFIAMPAIAIGIAYAFVAIGAPLVNRPDGVGDLPLTVIIIESFMPTAINAVIIANLFHLDARLASNLWLVNTILFFIAPLPVLLMIY